MSRASVRGITPRARTSAHRVCLKRSSAIHDKVDAHGPDRADRASMRDDSSSRAMNRSRSQRCRSPDVLAATVCHRPSSGPGDRQAAGTSRTTLDPAPARRGRHDPLEDGTRPPCASRTPISGHMGDTFQICISSRNAQTPLGRGFRMGRGGIEPPTLGLRVPCSAN